MDGIDRAQGQCEGGVLGEHGGGRRGGGADTAGASQEDPADGAEAAFVVVLIKAGVGVDGGTAPPPYLGGDGGVGWSMTYAG